MKNVGENAVEAGTRAGEEVAPSSDTEKIMRDLLYWAENTRCPHEETHRGGAIWEICDRCGAKWADDEGGRPADTTPAPIQAAHDWLDARRATPKRSEGKPAGNAAPDELRALLIELTSTQRRLIDANAEIACMRLMAGQAASNAAPSNK